MARYNTNGSLDAHFNKSGEILIDVPMNAFMTTGGEAVQPDGKTVVAGTAVALGTDNNEFAEIVLTRFNTDGSVDRSFGVNGSVIAQFAAGNGGKAAAVGVTIESNGKILVVGDFSGSINGTFVQDIGLAQFNANGSVDKTFGNGGDVLIDFGAGTTVAASGVAIEPNGNIVVAGTFSGFDSNFNFFRDFALASVTSSGAVNTAFGTNGQVITSFGTNTPATAAGLAIGPDGKIVVAGTANDPTTFQNEFALARYNTNGKLDRSFGTGGEVTTTFAPGAPASASSVAIGPDGKIVVAGSTTDQTTFTDSFALARYNTNGKLDASFGTGGEVIDGLSGPLQHIPVRRRERGHSI